MKILQCMYCKGELDVLQDKGVIKKIKCTNCGFSNNPEPKEPEVLIIRRRTST